ncbi:hypothetical protein emb_1d0655 [Coriobacteriaceae bacterium EMTCatB1]|nr:hypothetical protein emb_1d0655 [Coriobacteriaceae bacterium EMTCatB1]
MRELLARAQLKRKQHKRPGHAGALLVAGSRLPLCEAAFGVLSDVVGDEQHAVHPAVFAAQRRERDVEPPAAALRRAAVDVAVRPPVSRRALDPRLERLHDLGRIRELLPVAADDVDRVVAEESGGGVVHVEVATVRREHEHELGDIGQHLGDSVYRTVVAHLRLQSFTSTSVRRSYILTLPLDARFLPAQRRRGGAMCESSPAHLWMSRPSNGTSISMAPSGHISWQQ